MESFQLEEPFLVSRLVGDSKDGASMGATWHFRGIETFISIEMALFQFKQKFRAFQGRRVTK